MASNFDRKRTVEEAAADVYEADPAAVTAADAADAAASPSPSKSSRTAPTGTPGGGESNTSNPNKAYKGLRHFSMMVCKKVEEKGTTSYNEVADELVQRVLEDRRRDDDAAAAAAGNSNNSSSSNTKFDEKNIRRRVYDALNVLMAMDIIAKDKKEISWKGLPSTATQDLEMLYRERAFRQAEVERKRESLQELLLQQVCFRNLVDLNHQRSNESGAGTGGGADTTAKKMDNKIPLPFIVVNTSSSAVIQCNMSRDLTDVMFDFSMPFEINDDNTILKRLGL